MPKTKILLVEDDPAIRSICQAILRSDGFETIMATNGLEGLEIYGQRHEEICLVISDISMPFMTGIEMVRKLFELHSPPVIMLMSGASLRDFVPDEARGLCSMLEKPFTAGRLLEAVKSCLNPGSARSSSLPV